MQFAAKTVFDSLFAMPTLLATLCSCYVQDVFACANFNRYAKSGVDYYFVQQDGSKFKVLFKYNPYIYVAAEEGLEREVESVLRRKVCFCQVLFRRDYE